MNGSQTEEFTIQRGLKQGDPLAPFLFLLIAEGLSGLMSNAVSQGRFSGFKVGTGGCEVSILQYADDTLFVGEATWENLWVLKTVLRCFELALGLKINFMKSSLITMNVDDQFVLAASQFLNCKRGRLPFKYQGLPVGSNHRSCSTWQPVVDVMARRLAS